MMATMKPTFQRNFDFVVGDFYALWTAMKDSKSSHRGNYVFASTIGVLYRMALEEAIDKGGETCKAFRASLLKKNSKYHEILMYLVSLKAIYGDADLDGKEVAIMGPVHRATNAPAPPRLDMIEVDPGLVMMDLMDSIREVGLAT